VIVLTNACVIIDIPERTERELYGYGWRKDSAEALGDREETGKGPRDVMERKGGLAM